TPGAAYTLRLHFADINRASDVPRVHNFAIPSKQVLTNFDIFATAGNKDVAIVEPFSTLANSSGQIVIQFTTVQDNAKVSGIEIRSEERRVGKECRSRGLTAPAGTEQVALTWTAV